MKKIIALTLTLVMLLMLVACGNPNEKGIIGTWKLLDTETETEYGLGIQFTKDGKVRYGLTEDMFEEGDIEEALEGLDMLMTIKYKILSDTEMEITASALFGLAKESTNVTYSLDGDTLVFDGATYTREK